MSWHVVRRPLSNLSGVVEYAPCECMAVNHCFRGDEMSCPVFNGCSLMDLETIRLANQQRHIEWANGNEVSLSFRGLELAGEAGEACNELKKLERQRLGMVGGKADLKGLTEELADVLICVDLIAMDLGIDLGEAVKAKFNKTSQKYGLAARL
jgi:NTP pyrophosphatase (non-canonical NTP hydrolase)